MTSPVALLAFLFCALSTLNALPLAPQPGNFLNFDSLFDSGAFYQQAAAPSKIDNEAKTKRSAAELTEDARGDVKHSISLQSFIDNWENNLYDTAQNVGAAAKAEREQQPADGDHSKTAKRAAEGSASGSPAGSIAPPTKTTTTITTTAAPPTDLKVLLQTANLVPSAQDANTQVLLIDRIAVQPYSGNAPQYIIPAFQLQPITLRAVETKAVDGGVAPAEATKDASAAGTTTTTKQASVVKTTITAVSTSGGGAAAPSAPTTTTAKPTTTKPVAQLQKDENELKEKVAEIQAEPVILSARI